MTTTERQERPATATGSDFAELSRRINAAGLLRRRPALLRRAAGSGGRGVRRRLDGLLRWSAPRGGRWRSPRFLAVVFAQLALVAHDLAHRQVFRTNRPSAPGRARRRQPGDRHVLRLLDGQAHQAPRQPQPRRPRPRRRPRASSSGAARRLAAGASSPRHQAFLFLPLLTLLGISLKRDSVQALARRHGQASPARGRPARGPLRALPLGAAAPCSPRSRRSPSSWCTRRSSASTWASPSRPTTRACRTPTAPRTSCASRC